MAENSLIEWTDATWNPVTGCSVVSPGCTNCYAMRLAGTRLQHHPSRAGLTRYTKAGPVWNGQVRLNKDWLTQPLSWTRPRLIFVCAHADLFHEAVPDEWIDRVFAVMALAPQHTFQVLTKRSARMMAYMTSDWSLRVYGAIEGDPAGAAACGWLASSAPLPNVWLGVSAEDQRRADERVPDLLATPAAVRFFSAEPLLGSLDLVNTPFYDTPSSVSGRGYLRSVGAPADFIHPPKLDWIIVGGESGPGARPMHPDWARSLRDQCAAADVPFHFKQHGNWIGVEDLRRLPGGQGPGFGRFDHCQYDQEHEAVLVGKKAAGRLLDGVEHNGMPL